MCESLRQQPRSESLAAVQVRLVELCQGREHGAPGPHEGGRGSPGCDSARQPATIGQAAVQVLEGSALVMSMNVEEGIDFQMWRTLTVHFEPDLGSHSLSGLRQILGFKFRAAMCRGTWRT
jgi:hypothetical protein